jgi:hypothetical protein
LVSATDAVVPDMICIIGHPAGQPKRIEAGPTTAIVGNAIHYGDIDTLGGNSGSGILRASDGQLAGIHTNGGCTSASPGSGDTNFGQRIAAVIAASPTLQNLVNPTIPSKTKFIDDIKVPLDKPTSDIPNKTKFIDDVKPILDKGPQQDLGTLKFRDDRKFPSADQGLAVPGKLPTLDSPGSYGGTGRVGRPFGPETQPARPFILATPHHSTAWSGVSQQTDTLASLEAALARLEGVMAAGEAELVQLDTLYRQLLAQYEAAGGKLGGAYGG